MTKSKITSPKCHYKLAGEWIKNFDKAVRKAIEFVSKKNIKNFSARYTGA